jgi:large subunit ribosomal protein L27
MSTVKAAGTAKNLTDSKPKFLGTKLYDGEKAKVGSIIVRQRGTKIMPGKNVRVGKDHTIFSMVEGTVKFGIKRKKSFNGKVVVKKTVSVIK